MWAPRQESPYVDTCDLAPKLFLIGELKCRGGKKRTRKRNKKRRRRRRKRRRKMRRRRKAAMD